MGTCAANLDNGEEDLGRRGGQRHQREVGHGRVPHFLFNLPFGVGYKSGFEVYAGDFGARSGVVCASAAFHTFSSICRLGSGVSDVSVSETPESMSLKYEPASAAFHTFSSIWRVCVVSS